MNKTRLKEYLLLLPCAAAVFLWLLVDQVFLTHAALRFAALPVVALGALTLYFFILRPAEPFELAQRASSAVVCIAAVLILLRNVLIRFDVSYAVMFIFAIVMLTPFAAAFIYAKRVTGAR